MKRIALWRLQPGDEFEFVTAGLVRYRVKKKLPDYVLAAPLRTRKGKVYELAIESLHDAIVVKLVDPTKRGK